MSQPVSRPSDQMPRAGDASPRPLDIPLLTLRAVFFASAVGLGLYVANSFAVPEAAFVSMIVAGLLALAVIAVDALAVARSSIATVSAIVFGLLIGFLAAQLFIGIVSLVGDYEGPEGRKLLTVIRTAVTLIFCYLGPVFILRTKDDFRFIVPYVEFQKQMKGPRPLVLDTSAIIDGRARATSSRSCSASPTRATRRGASAGAAASIASRRSRRWPRSSSSASRRTRTSRSTGSSSRWPRPAPASS